MSNRDPNDNAETKEYIFYITGEIVVEDYSEDQAEEQLHDRLKELILEGRANGTIEIE